MATFHYLSRGRKTRGLLTYASIWHQCFTLIDLLTFKMRERHKNSYLISSISCKMEALVHRPSGQERVQREAAHSSSPQVGYSLIFWVSLESFLKILLEILFTPADERFIGLAGEVNHCQVGIGGHAESRSSWSVFWDGHWSHRNLFREDGMKTQWNLYKVDITCLSSNLKTKAKIFPKYWTVTLGRH